MAIIDMQHRDVSRVQANLDKLIAKKLKDQIDDEAYEVKRSALNLEQSKIRESVAQTEKKPMSG
jgi:ABC-type phosphate transport system auxiliary subunit